MELATRYVASQFEELGIEPGGEEGTYYQAVKIKRRSGEEIEDRNVIGVIKGEIEDEYVIVSAHLDAFGVGRELAGDAIYNRAVDNATGVAGLLEMGRVFKDRREKPKRTIILIALAAEELGLIGSRYYAEHPTFPVEKTLANINLDELLNHGKMTEICVIGRERSTLGKIADEVAEEMGLTVREKIPGFPDAFYLSDQISFARVGIPGILLYTGFEHEGRQEGWSKKKFDEYYAKKIHKPTDEYSEDWDMAGIMQIIRFAYEMTERVVEGKEWPKWYEGQPFKRIREKSIKDK